MSLNGADIDRNSENISHRSYIGIPVFLILWFGYKFHYKTKTIPAAQVDLVTGKREIDEEEARFIAAQELKGPRTRRQKLWDAL